MTRIDSWLWAVRVYKTRTLATEACRGGHVRLNNNPAKAAQDVKPGDEVRVRQAGFDRILIVRELISKRVGAPAAALAYEDRTPERPKPEEMGALPRRDRGAGRPTKRERRQTDRLMGRSE